MKTDKTYQHLETRQGSLYRQPFIKSTRIRAEIPYGYTVDKIDEEDGLTPGKRTRPTSCSPLAMVARCSRIIMRTSSCCTSSSCWWAAITPVFSPCGEITIARAT